MNDNQAIQMVINQSPQRVKKRISQAGAWSRIELSDGRASIIPTCFSLEKKSSRKHDQKFGLVLFTRLPIFCTRYVRTTVAGTAGSAVNKFLWRNIPECRPVFKVSFRNLGNCPHFWSFVVDSTRINKNKHEATIHYNHNTVKLAVTIIIIIISSFAPTSIQGYALHCHYSNRNGGIVWSRPTCRIRIIANNNNEHGYITHNNNED